MYLQVAHFGSKLAASLMMFSPTASPRMVLRMASEKKAQVLQPTAGCSLEAIVNDEPKACGLKKWTSFELGTRLSGPGGFSVNPQKP